MSIYNIIYLREQRVSHMLVSREEEERDRHWYVCCSI